MKLHRLVVLFFFLALVARGQELAPYPSPDAVLDEIRNMERLHPGMAEVFVAGKSAGGREILCVRIHRGDDKVRPAALIAGSIHGDEYIANRTAMAAAAMLLHDDDPVAEQVLERMDVYVLPLINPDGYVSTWESSGELPAKKTRTNDNEVDLNRNYGKPAFHIPLPMGFSGSKDPESTRYTGPAPFSEPESKAVRKLARDKMFFAAVDYHCSGGMIIPVLADDRYTQRGLHQAARVYKKALAESYIISMFPWWMPFYQGSMEECLYREAGTVVLLIELGKKKDFKKGKDINHFWRFNPGDPESIARVSKDNAGAALSALLEAYEYTGGKTEPHPIDVR